MSNDTLPEIRFPEFTDEWEQRKLGDESDVRDGTHDSPKYYDKGYPLVTSKNLKDFGLDLSNVSFISDEDFEVINKRSKVDIGDILFGMIGTIGNPVLVDRADFAIKNVALIKEQKKILNSFLIQILKSPVFDKYIKNENAGGTQKFLSLSKVRDFNFLCPNIDEQNCISAFFKKLDDTIALHQRKLDLLKETKKGFLQKMFPKNGAKVPEIRFPGFTEDWEQRKVGEIFKVTRGQVLAATETSESITEKNIYPVYSSQTKNDGLMGYYSDYLFDTAITWTTDGANAGTVNYRNGKFYSTNVNGVLLSDKGYANKAVAEIINRIAWKHVSKVGNPKLMNNVMSEIIITIPSVEEQETISRFFTQLDSTITLHERELDLLKETKKGFLQKMFV
ncbi:restriction endonuclease subunit S [Enterococcus faecium]|uniref:restriction endonuclease subunit S n=1 Tax=Enterococcus faecium TaxID=1352 RepID=UPI000F51541E|nr:restriction endonuclease subunit S [Enterococcus faecium]MDV7729589.1 restriction endonuclease subunit S [Enterococcus faecium]ROZ16796.1 restriction endonuclease subunit S [Enterococcus faecium]